ncbi:hypothetical protein PF005_g25405 [Phytophthora fragariae]|uniref:Uncharacterized protein n=1 Tax=Phytophthora fragariae TaxID=53985 RepID=A0A6A3VZS7_9STRA|nr:hypothetical protein PF005_g25405 [Phytophthora fragariae]KAE9183627.1 hypothetical protein PF004_g23895 [Phytophthora fragariae]
MIATALYNTPGFESRGIDRSWRASQLFPHLQEIIRKYPGYFNKGAAHGDDSANDRTGGSNTSPTIQTFPDGVLYSGLRAASGFASLAHETEQTVEWTACKNRANGTKWTRITEHIQMDVAQWIAERSKSPLYEGAEDKVWR